MIPFAVVGSERTVIIDGKPVRGRKNRWGVVNVEDERHCEFVYLRNFLTRSVMLLCDVDSLVDHNRLDLQDTPPGPDRDDCTNSLRGLPVKTAPRAQGADQPPVRRGAVSSPFSAAAARKTLPPAHPAPGVRCDTPQASILTLIFSGRISHHGRNESKFFVRTGSLIAN